MSFEWKRREHLVALLWIGTVLMPIRIRIRISMFMPIRIRIGIKTMPILIIFQYFLQHFEIFRKKVKIRIGVPRILIRIQQN